MRAPNTFTVIPYFTPRKFHAQIVRAQSLDCYNIQTSHTLDAFASNNGWMCAPDARCSLGIDYAVARFQTNHLCTKTHTHTGNEWEARWFAHIWVYIFFVLLVLYFTVRRRGTGASMWFIYGIIQKYLYSSREDLWIDYVILEHILMCIVSAKFLPTLSWAKQKKKVDGVVTTRMHSPNIFASLRRNVVRQFLAKKKHTSEFMYKPHG